MKAVTAVLGVLALAGWVHTQCVTDDDSLVVPGTPDLRVITPFSLGLFGHLYPPESRENFFFSPFSIWNALGLAYLGSAGETENQLKRALLVDKTYALAYLKALDRFYRERQAQSTDYTIDLANRVYVDQSFTLPKCVTQVLEEKVQNIDFRSSDAAAATINNFVKNVTRNKIPRLVNGGDVVGAKMVLVNAAYFKGLWYNRFLTTDTRKQKFYSTPTQYTMVDMMHQKADFKYGDSSEVGAKVLEMPYKGEAASMFVFLPHETDDPSTDPMEAMLRRLTPDNLRGAMSNLYTNEVIVQIPKFKLEQTITDKLKQGLQRLGIEDLFSNRSNLEVYDPLKRLYASKGIHKAVVEVNEEGAEAAAATGIIIGITSITLPVSFICDRPFLFFIYDNDVNNILFMGVYRQPQN